MNTEEKLKGIDKILEGLPEDERNELRKLYEDLIDAAEKNNNHKRHTVDGTDLIFTNETIEVAEKGNAGNVTRVIFASIGLFFFNIMFVLGPYLGVVGTFFGLSITSLALVISPLAMFTPFYSGPEGIAIKLFLASTMIGLGLLLGVGMYVSCKWLAKGTVSYIRWNLKLIKGDM